MRKMFENNSVYTHSDALRQASYTDQSDLPPIIVKFTKSELKDLFDNRVQNRKIKPKIVTKYTKLMSLGDVDNGWSSAAMYENPIKIDRHGKLVAGQHRFLAAFRSENDEHKFAVQYNCSEIGRRLQDSNGGRKTNEELYMFFPDPGWDNISTPARSASLKMLYHIWMRPDDTTYRTRGTTAENMANMMITFKSSFEDLDKTLEKKPKRDEILSKCPYIVAAILSHKKMAKEPELKEKWKKIISELSDPSSTDPYASVLYTLEAETDRDNEARRYGRCLKALRVLKALLMSEPCPTIIELSNIDNKILEFWR